MNTSFLAHERQGPAPGAGKAPAVLMNGVSKWHLNQSRVLDRASLELRGDRKLYGPAFTPPQGGPGWARLGLRLWWCEELARKLRNFSRISGLGPERRPPRLSTMSPSATRLLGPDTRLASASHIPVPSLHTEFDKPPVNTRNKADSQTHIPAG